MGISRNKDIRIKCLLIIFLGISPLLTASEELDANNNPPTLDVARRQRISKKSAISYRSFDRDDKQDIDSNLPHLNLVDELRRKTPSPVTPEQLTTPTKPQTEKPVLKMETVTSAMHLNHSDDGSLMSFLKGITPKPPNSDGQRSAKRSKKEKFQGSERSASLQRIHEKAPKFSPMILVTTIKTDNSSPQDNVTIPETTLPAIIELKETVKLDESANDTVTSTDISVGTSTLFEQSLKPTTDEIQNPTTPLLTTTDKIEALNTTIFITTELDELTSTTGALTTVPATSTTLKESTTTVETTTVDVTNNASTSMNPIVSQTEGTNESTDATTESTSVLSTTSESFEPIPSADKEVMKREPNQAALAMGLVFLFLAVMVVLAGFLMYRRLKKRNRSDPEGQQRFSRVFRDW